MLRDVCVNHEALPKALSRFSQQEALFMMTQETEFLNAQQQFQHLCDLMRQAGREGWRLDEIERRAMPELMRLGLEFLTGHVEGQGNGDAGPEVTHDNRTLHRSEVAVHSGVGTLDGFPAIREAADVESWLGS
jgi:hypothetical protein